MRVAITGATGFVGRVIAHHLTSRGHEIESISRLGATAADLTDPQFAEAVSSSVAPCEAIVHCAANLDKDSPAMILCNTLGTRSVLALAEQWQSRALIYLSSLPVIGVPRFLPIAENHPVAPPTVYHATKLFGEHLMTLAQTATLRTLSLRLTAPIGRDMPSHRILPVFLGRALQQETIKLAGRGTRTQNYVDVRDVAQAVLLSLTSSAHGILNIAGSDSVSNLELARLCIGLTGSGSSIECQGVDAEEGVHWEVSIMAARASLGYHPAYSLEQSIRDLAASL